MVISIIPKSRASFNDLATLEIRHSRGSLTTPNRIVNRHDINAKDHIGADIPLTRSSKSFIIQEMITKKMLDNVLTKNGFLGDLKYKYSNIIQRLDPKTCVFLYPSLTNESLLFLYESKKYKEFIRFFTDLASFLDIESVISPTFNDLSGTLKLFTAKNIQLIPILKLNEDFVKFKDEFELYKTIGNGYIPILALKFVSYPSANLTYNFIMDNLDKLHERNQGTMIINTPRIIQYSNLSAIHYASFLIGDLIAENYSTFRSDKSKPNIDSEGKNIPIKSPTKTVKLFHRYNLAIQQASENPNLIHGDSKIFSNDYKLVNLFEKIIRNQTDDSDWKKNRPSYLSRIHENIQSRTEFDILQKNIESNSTLDYLKEKNEMNFTITDQLKKIRYK